MHLVKHLLNGHTLAKFELWIENVIMLLQIYNVSLLDEEQVLYGGKIEQR